MSRRERALIRRIRARDEKAFRQLVELHRDRVYNMCYRMLGNRAEAEDLSQEVFITVFKSIDSFRGDAKFSTWLYRVTANHCKNRIKYLSRRHDRDRTEYDERIDSSKSASSSPGSTPNPSPRPDRQLEGVQLELTLQRAIDELEDDQRLLIVLRDIEELAIKEICAITGLVEGTVKSRLHRARMALRKKMKKHME